MAARVSDVHLHAERLEVARDGARRRGEARDLEPGGEATLATGTDEAPWAGVPQPLLLVLPPVPVPTLPLCWLVAVLVPASFFAVTCTRSVPFVSFFCTW